MPATIEPPKASPTPPAAPAAAPATPAPAAAPVVAPSPAPATPPPDAGGDNPFEELDAKFKAGGTVPAADPKSPDQKKGEPAPAPGKPATPGKQLPPDFRKELDRVKGELDTKTKAYSELETKIADYEKRGKDTSVLTERLTLLEKQMGEKDAEIRALKQEASPEFKAKYDVPFNRLADRAKGVVEAIQIETKNPETEEVTSRAATWNDFTKLYNLNEFLANKEAKKMFGDDGAAVAMRYYNELHRLDDDRRVALDEEKAKWKEKETTEQATSVQRQEQINKLWEQTNKDLSENEEDYHDSPEDKELEEARQKGYQIFDAPPKSMKEKIVKDAHIRQRVAAFAPMKLKLMRLTVERDELKKELEGMKADPPGKNRRPGGTPPAGEPTESWEDGARKAVTA